jgi:hypothetical protein
MNTCLSLGKAISVYKMCWRIEHVIYLSFKIITSECEIIYYIIIKM